MKYTYHLLISSRFSYYYYYLGDTYVDVSPFDFVKIFIIYLLFIILPRICSQDISRLNKAIVMKLSMMIDLSLT